MTGAASGIGRATTLLFAREDARVAMADVNAGGLADTSAMMAQAPSILHYDAGDYDSCRALIARASRDGLDVLCNVSYQDSVITTCRPSRAGRST